MSVQPGPGRVQGSVLRDGGIESIDAVKESAEAALAALADRHEDGARYPGRIAMPPRSRV
jgi:hypothetical protein